MQNDGNYSPNAQPGAGMAPNLAGALSYVLGLVTGIVFLMMSKDRFVRFHAYQSIFLTLAWVVFWIAFSVVSTVIGFVPFLRFLVAIIGLLLSLGLGLGGMALWIVLILKAYQGQQWKLPYIGDLAERYAAS